MLYSDTLQSVNVNLGLSFLSGAKYLRNLYYATGYKLTKATAPHRITSTSKISTRERFTFTLCNVLTL